MFCAVGHWGQGKIWRFTNNILAAQTYFCEADVPGGGILIDAGLDYEALDQELSKIQRFPSHIFCTHGHFDHIWGAAGLKEASGAKIYCAEADAPMLTGKAPFISIMQAKLKTQLSSSKTRYGIKSILTKMSTQLPQLRPFFAMFLMVLPWQRNTVCHPESSTSCGNTTALT